VLKVLLLTMLAVSLMLKRNRPFISSPRVVGALSITALVCGLVMAFPLIRQHFSQPQTAALPSSRRPVPENARATNIVSAPQPQTGPPFDLSRNVIAAGGTTSTGGDFRIEGTIGQAAVGTVMSDGQFSQTGGFWHPELAATTPTPTPMPTPTPTPTATPSPTPTPNPTPMPTPTGTPTPTPSPTPTPTPSPVPSPSASPLIQFNASVYLVNEGGGSASITVTRSGNTSGPSSIEYRTADTDTFTVGCATKQGQAFGRCDFATVVGTLSFAPGETSKTFTVPIIDDAYSEGTETFSVVLSNPVNATLGSLASAIVSITDNESSDGANPILVGNDVGIDFFVRQHYLDFLGREPEPGQPWSNVLRNCADQFNTNPSSPSAGCDRITISGAFFGSPEFRDKGIYLIDFYRVTLNRLPTYLEFSPDLASITGATAAETNAKRAAYAVNFTERAEFAGIYAAMNNQAFVNALMSGNTAQGGLGQNYNLTAINSPDPANPDGGAKVTLTTSDLINRLNAGTMTRPQTVRAIVQSDQITQNLEALNAFVASQYYGYLRRTPDNGGFNGWVNYLRNNPNDFRTMVHGFVNSNEYRLRFGPL
jgi:hypothetical protein